MTTPPPYTPPPAARRGPFIVLEGVSGIGKSTLTRILAARIGAAALHTLPAPHSAWSETANTAMKPLPQFAFYLSGLLHASDLVRQQLARGPVIADRYASSVIACHAAVHHLHTDDVTRLLTPFTPYLTAPDHTFYLRCSPNALRERMTTKQDLKADDTALFGVPGRLERLVANFDAAADADTTAIRLDTDGISPRQLADTVLNHLEQARA
ncbi:thymidylate kinase [Streptomyces sp. NPDC014733]|uniref:thymidylate kinase n=1 Tax=Streptomyces sp. NPDC014733 TaxID=3364885 RepID=UPI0036FC6871